MQAAEPRNITTSITKRRTKMTNESDPASSVGTASPSNASMTALATKKPRMTSLTADPSFAVQLPDRGSHSVGQ